MNEPILKLQYMNEPVLKLQYMNDSVYVLPNACQKQSENQILVRILRSKLFTEAKSQEIA